MSTSITTTRWSAARFLIGLGRRSPAALLSSRHRRSPAEQEWKTASDHDIEPMKWITMAVKRVAHPSVEQRTARGNDARTRTPRSAHAGWKSASDRPDPVGLLEEQDATREPDLVPVRHGRMMVSPFTFYRGAAKIMAADLKDTPRASVHVQLCGDAHLSNFGLFGSVLPQHHGPSKRPEPRPGIRRLHLTPRSPDRNWTAEPTTP
jgi:hypothetical protein